MLIYLDTCCLQRPLDDRTQPRINVEAEAILTILGLVEKQYLKLAGSEALDFEISRISDANRKSRIEEMLRLTCQQITVNDEIQQSARVFMTQGIKPMDALHLASAISAGVDYFCTTDDNFLKKAKVANSGNTKVTSPLELITEVAR
ncbi:PIN domain-containing protein [Thiothrix subterranea]|uniref:PIN domain-containing protein n=1 Tax=Thiothrix subterranea TaxID=2735563 RepID=A0ABU0YA09_9GAMM|nr:PIN domain-containing protein [Thiothrix subterranea]MDQ5769615.1 PIN domain-containing protein [Thiothrix subterranea]